MCINVHLICYIACAIFECKRFKYCFLTLCSPNRPFEWLRANVSVSGLYFFTRNKTFGASHLLYGGGGYVVNHPVALTLLPPLLTQLHIYKDIRHLLSLTQNFGEIAGLAFVKKTQCFTQPPHCTLVPKPQCIKMERLALQCCARERLD